MDIRLIRRPHTNQMVRASGIEPTDPYLEMCWLPVVGPSTTALVRHIAHVTADGGEAHVPLSDVGRQLGLGPVEVPSRNNRLIRTRTRAEQFGLAFSSINVPGESMTLGITSEIALVPNRMLERLPYAARQYHAATVEAVNEALTSAGMPTLHRHAAHRDVAPAGPVSPGGVDRPAVTPRPTAGAPTRTRQAVPPMARLVAHAPAPTAPDLSL
jgi:hypothetical protein